MADLNMVTLENGVEYAEVDSLVYNDTKYILLANIKNVKDSCIRKLSLEDNKEYLLRLTDDNEFDLILDLFMKQNKTLFN